MPPDFIALGIPGWKTRWRPLADGR